MNERFKKMVHKLWNVFRAIMVAGNDWPSRIFLFVDFGILGNKKRPGLGSACIRNFLSCRQ